MKRINDSNYEIYFLDFADGNLSPGMVDELLDFLGRRPELAEELKAISGVKLPVEDIVFPDKESLFREFVSGADAGGAVVAETLAGRYADVGGRVSGVGIWRGVRHVRRVAAVLAFFAVVGAAIFFQGVRNGSSSGEATPVGGDVHGSWHISSEAPPTTENSPSAGEVPQSAHEVNPLPGESPSSTYDTASLAGERRKPTHGVHPLGGESSPSPRVAESPVIGACHASAPVVSSESGGYAALSETGDQGVREERKAATGEIVAEHLALIYSREPGLSIGDAGSGMEPEYESLRRRLGGQASSARQGEPVTVSGLAVAGLGLVGGIGNYGFAVEKNKEGNVTRINFDTQLLGFSIPRGKNR